MFVVSTPKSSISKTSVPTFICVMSVCAFLSACSGGSNELEPNSLLVEGETLGRASGALANETPFVTDLTATNIRPGFVSIQWQSANGDTNQTTPSGDSVSYYRVYRNGEFFLDVLSPAVEDNSPPAGAVIYSVEAHKFVTSPDYDILRSKQTHLSINMPTHADTTVRLSGELVTEHSYMQALLDFQHCSNSQLTTTSVVICANEYGYAWNPTVDGTAARLLGNKSSLSGDQFVSVRNRESGIEILPGIPSWTVSNLSTGETLSQPISLGTTFLAEGEGYVVNGVATSDDGRMFVSGTLYQSHLPRNLGIEVGIVPVTNAYYIAELEIDSGDLVQVKRFSLAEAPGAAVTINNGLLEMHKVGKVSYYDTGTLAKHSSVDVTGFPVFANGQYVLTQSFGPQAYYRFEL